jgi:outer membrane receptor protein involved in Fe transport
VSLRHRFIGAVTTDRYVLAKRNAERAGNQAGVDAANAALATYTNAKFSAKNYFDLSVSYDFGEKAEIHAGVNNLLDSDPPIVAGFGGYGNTFPATYDYAGMTIFLGVTVKTF